MHFALTSGTYSVFPTSCASPAAVIFEDRKTVAWIFLKHMNFIWDQTVKILFLKHRMQNVGNHTLHN